MSIIEETLRNLQEKQKSSDGVPEITSIEITQSFIDREQSKIRLVHRIKVYVVFIILVLVIGFAANMGLDMYLDGIEKEKRASIAALNVFQVKKEAPLPTGDVAKAPEAPLPAMNQEPVRTAAAPPKEDEPQPDQEIAGSGFDEQGWIKDGWAALDEKSPEAALDIWMEGFQSIPDKQIVLVMLIVADHGKAIRLLKRIGPGHSAFAVKGKYNGSDSIYLLSVPPAEAFKVEQNEIANILGMDTIKGNHKDKLLARMLMDAAKAKPVPVSEKAVLAQDVDQNKPPVIAQPEVTIPPPVEEPRLNIEEIINAARRDLNSGLYSRAVKRLEPLIDSDEKRWEAYLLIGMAYLGRGELAEAENYLDEGLAITERQPALWLQRALVEQEKGEHKKALQLLHRAETIAPAIPELKLNTGYSNDAIGKMREAAKAYTSFLKLTDGKPGYAEVRRAVQKRLLEIGR